MTFRFIFLVYIALQSATSLIRPQCQCDEYLACNAKQKSTTFKSCFRKCKKSSGVELSLPSSYESCLLEYNHPITKVMQCTADSVLNGCNNDHFVRVVERRNFTMFQNLTMERMKKVTLRVGVDFDFKTESLHNFHRCLLNCVYPSENRCSRKLRCGLLMPTDEQMLNELVQCANKTDITRGILLEMANCMREVVNTVEPAGISASEELEIEEGRPLEVTKTKEESLAEIRERKTRLPDESIEEVEKEKEDEEKKKEKEDLEDEVAEDLDKSDEQTDLTAHDEEEESTEPSEESTTSRKRLSLTPRRRQGKPFSRLIGRLRKEPEVSKEKDEDKEDEEHGDEKETKNKDETDELSKEDIGEEDVEDLEEAEAESTTATITESPRKHHKAKHSKLQKIKARPYQEKHRSRLPKEKLEEKKQTHNLLASESPKIKVTSPKAHKQHAKPKPTTKAPVQSSEESSESSEESEEVETESDKEILAKLEHLEVDGETQNRTKPCDCENNTIIITEVIREVIPYQALVVKTETNLESFPTAMPLDEKLTSTSPSTTAEDEVTETTTLTTTTTSEIEETTTSEIEETTTSEIEETTTSEIEENTTSEIEETTTVEIEESSLTTESVPSSESTSLPLTETSEKVIEVTDASTKSFSAKNFIESFLNTIQMASVPSNLNMTEPSGLLEVVELENLTLADNVSLPTTQGIVVLDQLEIDLDELQTSIKSKRTTKESQEIPRGCPGNLEQTENTADQSIFRKIRKSISDRFESILEMMRVLRKQAEVDAAKSSKIQEGKKEAPELGMPVKLMPAKFVGTLMPDAGILGTIAQPNSQKTEINSNDRASGFATVDSSSTTRPAC